VAQLPQSASDDDVKNLFKTSGVFPEEVHWVTNEHGKRTGYAFVAVKSRDLRKGMSVDGIYFRGNQVNIYASNPAEFNAFFPNTPMSKRSERPRDNWNFDTHSTYQAKTNEASFTTNKSFYHNERFVQSPRSNTNIQQYSSFEERGNYSSPYNTYTINGDDYKTTPSPSIRPPPSRPSLTTDPFHQEGFHKTYFEKKEPIEQKYRSRSRSPHSSQPRPAKKENSKTTPKSEEKKKDKRKSTESSKSGEINVKKYVRIFGMSFHSKEDDFKSFLKPLEVCNVYLLKFKSGDNAGKVNGSAIIELRKEENALKALSYDGNNYKSQPIQVVRSAKEDILAAIEEKQNKSMLKADLKTLNDLANSNPQIQHLVGLLNEAVSNATSKDKHSPSSSSKRSDSTSKKSTSSAASTRISSKHHASSSSSSSKREVHKASSIGSTHQKDDHVINRVASSANINVEDIKSGRVVGMRNLPGHVNTDMILDFFVGYNRVDESVRIHYLDNGKCSGDAIIAFRNSQEATRAVQNLNKKSVVGRKVELFFL